MIKRALDFQRKVTGESFFGTVRRYFIFVFGGAIGWLIVIGFHVFFRDSYGFNPVVSYAFGIFFADLFTFIYHRFITFRIKSNWQVRFVQFSALVVLISIANWSLFFLGRGVLDLPVADWIMSFLITGFLSVVNFFVNRIFIFRSR